MSFYQDYQEVQRHQTIELELPIIETEFLVMQLELDVMRLGLLVIELEVHMMQLELDVMGPEQLVVPALYPRPRWISGAAAQELASFLGSG